ncbi:TPA: site-specific DNA-methyltransferase [Campylobacter jejuni]|nr:site-specific DNA-methyltransferase [Campylobacter jejuni]
MSDYKIYNCDCIEFMQDMVNQGKKVDCIITDPPYLYLNHKLDRQFNEDDFYCLINDLKRVFSSVKNSDIIKDYLEKGIRILKLNKSKHSITTNKIVKNVDRNIKTINKYKEGCNLSSIITENREHYTMEHPTQKPVKLLEKLVLLATNENETILDPFMGSGSTGLACLFKNRNFIGCEIDKEYFEIAERRLKSTQDTLKQNLFYGMDI